ncbi:MAG: hypothetical protein HKN15_03940 [Xanthomonadales bacterium]|nr:hypothetical protein [Xanthomonadales bacterium]
MIDAINRLERKAFKSFWNDGLLDVMLGMMLLVLGVSWWQDVAVLGAVFPAVCVSMWAPLRKRLIEPRMGFVEFSEGRELKARTFRFGLAGFFAATMLLGILVFSLWGSDIMPKPAEWIAGFPLLLLAIPAALFSAFTQCRRFAVYALLMLLAGIEVVILDWQPHVGMLASGAVILLSGSVILARFMINHRAARDANP